MNLSAITVSFPLDEETFEELQNLCRVAEIDGHVYNQVMNLPVARNYDMRGFYVLVYDDEKNELVGAGTAIDVMGLNTYEWSILVAPMYRQLGIGDALLNMLREGMVVRGAEGELALCLEDAGYGRAFLESRGYGYSFSEATLEAKAERLSADVLPLRPYNEGDVESLVAIFSEAFGDMREESLDLIAFNTATAGLKLWVAEVDGIVVGTVTTRKEGEAQWITAFAVAPHMQGRGIGTAILNWVKDYAAQGGEKLVLLDVEIDNAGALAVYEKAGFMKVTQIDYYAFEG